MGGLPPYSSLTNFNPPPFGSVFLGGPSFLWPLTPNFPLHHKQVNGGNRNYCGTHARAHPRRRGDKGARGSAGNGRRILIWTRCEAHCQAAPLTQRANKGCARGARAKQCARHAPSHTRARAHTHAEGPTCESVSLCLILWTEFGTLFGSTDELEIQHLICQICLL